MKFVHWIELCMLLGSCNCASVSTTTSTVVVKDEPEELVPLELPARYENKIKSLIPQLFDRLGIPSSLVSDTGLLSSSISGLSNGFGYFNSLTTSTNQEVCKSKLVDDRLKVTKHGMSMCKQQCLNKSKERVHFIRNIFGTIYGNVKDPQKHRIQADIEINTENKKMYECLFDGQRYDCVCMKNETLKVTPHLKSLILQLLKGGDKRRGLIPDVSKEDILIMIMLFLAERALEVVAAPVVLPLKMLYHAYHVLKMVT